MIGAASQIGHDLLAEHRQHLARRTWQHDSGFPAALHNRARSGAVVVFQNDTAARHHRLFEVVFRHLAAHLMEITVQVPGGRLVQLQRHAEITGDRFLA